MDNEQFRQAAYDMVDFLVDYVETLRARNVHFSVEPGYIRPLLPTEPPQDPEPWDQVIKDIEPIIMPGVNTTYNIIVDSDCEGIVCQLAY